MATNARGTAIWLYDTTGTAVVKLGCPTSYSGIGLSRDITESEACLETGETTKFTGNLKKNDITININWGAESDSHKLIWDAVANGTEDMAFVIGLSGDNTAPTWVAGDWSLATARSWIKITASVATMNIDLSSPSYKGTITLSVKTISTIKATT